MKNTDNTCFAPCPRGLEELLVKELTQLGAKEVNAVGGGVNFSANWETVYRINLHSRIAIRVLWLLGQGKVETEHDLYLLTKKIAWHTYFGLDKTFRVKVEAKKTKFQNLGFLALTIKDAICDEFRQIHDERPDVNKSDPDIRVQGFIDGQDALIYIDTSGESLFKRGYRMDKGAAPLRENLAAGLLMLAGYNGKQPLLDPMCGSGTIAIEAALMAQNKAVGLYRTFAFENMSHFDDSAWQKLKQNAVKMQKEASISIVASDINPNLIQDAKKNASAAGVADLIKFSVSDVINTRPQGEHGLIVTNPPYGMRLDDEEHLAALYPQLGSWLKQYFSGWTACFVTGDLRFPKLMRLSPKRRWPLYNGAIDCRLFVFDMVAGTNRK